MSPLLQVRSDPPTETASNITNQHPPTVGPGTRWPELPNQNQPIKVLSFAENEVIRESLVDWAFPPWGWVWVCFWNLGVTCLQTVAVLLISACLHSAWRMELIWSLHIPPSPLLQRPFQLYVQATTSWFWQQLWISCSAQVAVSCWIMKFSPNHLLPKSRNYIFIRKAAAGRKSGQRSRR